MLEFWTLCTLVFLGNGALAHGWYGVGRRSRACLLDGQVRYLHFDVEGTTLYRRQISRWKTINFKKN